MRGRVCPKCRGRTVIYVAPLKLSWCTNPECKYESVIRTFEKHVKKHPKMAFNSTDVFDRVPGLKSLVSQRAEFTAETLAIGLHAIALEERIEQGHIIREQAPSFDELMEESQDVYRVIARFIKKYYVPRY